MVPHASILYTKFMVQDLWRGFRGNVWRKMSRNTFMRLRIKFIVFSVATRILIKLDVSLIVEQMCKNLSPTKTRRGNCLVFPHTGYALDDDVRTANGQKFHTNIGRRYADARLKSVSLTRIVGRQSCWRRARCSGLPRSTAAVCDKNSLKNCRLS